MSSILVLIIAILAYYFIIFGKVKKSIIVFTLSLILIGMKAVDGLNLENIGEVVNFNTLGLLFGMMIIVAVLKSTGFFQYAAVKMIKLAGGSFWKTLIFLMILVFLVSAFLDNLITIILLSPMIFLIADTMGMNPVPLIILTIFIDNIGGMSTLIGSPLNIVLGSISELSFNDFLKNLGGFAAVAFVVTLLVFKRKLKVTSEMEEKLKGISVVDPRKAITDLKTLKKAFPIFLIVLVGFSIHSVIEVDLSIVALLGASLLLLSLNADFEKLSKDIDWDTLFFYMGLFVISYSLEKIGVISSLAEFFGIFKDHPIVLGLFVMWFSALTIPFLSAVPGTLILAPALKLLVDSGISPNIWWAFALGANIGTNLTPLGAVQNIVGIALLEKHSEHTVSFGKFFKEGFKTMFPSLILASVYVIFLMK